MSWQLLYTKQAQKDAKKLASSGLKQKAETLLKILESNPFQNPPPFEKLAGDLAGAYSRRINVRHRLVYQVLSHTKIIKVIRLWSHYDLSPNHSHHRTGRMRLNYLENDTYAKI